MLINLTQTQVLAHRVYCAETFWKRLKGLLGKKELPAGEALVIVPCRSVHTFFMRFPIDVLFLDQQQRIVSLHPNLKPFKVTPVISKAKCAVELPAHRTQETGCRLGDILHFTTNEADI